MEDEERKPPRSSSSFGSSSQNHAAAELVTVECIPTPFHAASVFNSTNKSSPSYEHHCGDTYDNQNLIEKHVDRSPISKLDWNRPYDDLQSDMTAAAQNTQFSGSEEHFSPPSGVVIPKKFSSQYSPEGNAHFKYQESAGGDIRHQLLVQRTFNNQEDHPEPRTSSPLRKVRITVSSGIQTTSVSPSKESQRTVNENSDMKDPNLGQVKHASALSPYLMSPTERAQGFQPIFKTPNRNQRPHHERGIEMTPSHAGASLLMSPASSLGFTPGRQFINPFEIDHERMHMPFFSPNMFKVTGSANKDKKRDKENFWSVEHSALIKPVDINEAEVKRQHRYQQRIDLEQDSRLQSAINKFFSNEVIVPSPWSEKVKHVLPRTPGAIRSVSCQTTMSVPPGVDLLAELQGKYQLPDYRTEPSPFSESVGNSFIRRKLLNQLNENDSDLLGSPALQSRVAEEVSSSPSPGHQTTPEWEKQTPSKVGSGHFSSSPIRQGPDERGHQHALSESDLLASPELSPIARRASKSVRSSGVFYPPAGEESPRAIMQLDFSSILDDPDDMEEDRAGTLMQKGLSLELPMDTSSQTNALSKSADHQFGAISASQDSERNLAINKSGSQSCQAFLTSALSSESTNEMAVTVPQSSSNQDTGYQTASLQSTNQDFASNSNLTSHEGGPLVMSDVHSLASEPNSNPFSDLPQQRESVLHSNITEEFTRLKYTSDRNSDIDGSFLGLAFGACKEKSSSADDVMLPIKEEPSRVRKIRTLSDIRFPRERSNVSRDLTQSFNEELEKSDSNMAVQNSWSNSFPSSFAPVVSKIVNQNHPGMALKPSPNSHLGNPGDCCTGNLQKPHDSDNAVDGCNIFETGQRSASPFSNSSWDKKGLNLSSDSDMKPLSERQTENINIYEQTSGSGTANLGEVCVSRFALGDDSTLKQARLFLGKSEEFRQKLCEQKSLESASLYQMFASNTENQDPLAQQSPYKDVGSRPQTPNFSVNPIDSSTPTSQKLSSTRKKIDSVQGSKLGSEIAAEILKRAGEDLAKLTDMLNSKSPSTD